MRGSVMLCAHLSPQAVSLTRVFARRALGAAPSPRCLSQLCVVSRNVGLFEAVVAWQLGALVESLGDEHVS
jgi:hypothetical protein